MLRRILLAAGLAGVLVGLVLTGLQALRVVPLILEAETYETGLTPTTGQPQAPVAHAVEHQHEDDQGWAPGDGWPRLVSTLAANVVTAVGFALLLAGAYSLLGDTVDWRRGLRWGAAGYAVFFVAPSLGLPPELPGTLAANLFDRQGWWLLTVACSAPGLWLLVKGGWSLKLAGLALLAAPHLLGAPEPAYHSSLAPEALQRQFVLATALTNAAFWLLLGIASAWAWTRLRA